MRNSMVYLDNAASTPVAPEVLAAMMASLSQMDDIWANASSTHVLGKLAQTSIAVAMQTIAEQLHCHPDAIIVTSGATESINQALKGVMWLQKKRRHLITTTIEHKATLQVVHSLMNEGVSATFLAPNSSGQITLDMIQAAITPETALVSLIWVNNETGTILEIEKISAYLRSQKILLHVDATQAIPRMSIDASLIDLISMSAHKCYGPKGVGLLIRRDFPKLNLKPVIEGSDAQMGIRAGTLPNHQIIGLAEALRSLGQHYSDQERQHIYQHQFVLDALQGLQIEKNGGDYTSPSIMNLYMPQVMSETLMYLLPNTCFSAGSACHSAHHDPSHVLTEMGRSPLAARQSIRISFGRFTTDAILEKGIMRIQQAASYLQDLAQGRPAVLSLATLDLDQTMFENHLLIEHLIQPCFIQFEILDLKTFNRENIVNLTHQTDEYVIDLDVILSNQRDLDLLMINVKVSGCPYLIALLSILVQKIRSLSLNAYLQFNLKEYLVSVSKSLTLPASKIGLPIMLENLFKQIGN